MDDFEGIFSAEALLLWASDSFSSATLSQTTAAIITGDNVALNPSQRQDHVPNDHVSCSDPTHQPRQATLVDDISDLDPLIQNKRKRKRRTSPDAIPGCLTIKPIEAQGPKLKRSKFQPERKDEVAKIRRIGACLRCRHLKISVSWVLLYLYCGTRQQIDYISALRYGLAHLVAVAKALAAVERQISDGWTRSPVPSTRLISMLLV